MIDQAQEAGPAPEPAPTAEPGVAARPVVDAADRTLDPRVVRLWRAGSALRTLGWAAAVIALAWFTPWQLPWAPIVGAVLGLGTAATVMWPPARFRAWSFRMRERDLVVHHGVLWRTVSVFPYARIQHVDTRHGPLERWLGLASLIIYTAGVRGADVEIPGLAAAEAESLREHLAVLGGTEDAV